MMLRIVSSLRMAATTTTLKGLPAARKRSAKRRITGLKRMALKAAMYNTHRTVARPPKMLRLPRIRPESRLIGATPTNAATCWRLSLPSSGRSATSWLAVVWPTPGTLVSRSRWFRQWSSDSIRRAMSPVLTLLFQRPVPLFMLAPRRYGSQGAAACDTDVAATSRGTELILVCTGMTFGGREIISGSTEVISGGTKIVWIGTPAAVAASENWMVSVATARGGFLRDGGRGGRWGLQAWFRGVAP
jgi:hypothetical protein